MENRKKINAMPYGFALVSVNTFENCRKQEKIRTKKMLSFFDKNHNQFYKFILEGAFLPIHHLINDRYTLFFSVNGEVLSDVDENWNKVEIWKKFPLYIDSSNSIWAIEFEEMESWNHDIYKDADSITGVYYDLNDNPHIDYKAIKYTISEGFYSVDIIGLKKKIIEGRRENYGFLFILTQIEKITMLSDSSEINFHALFEK